MAFVLDCSMTMASLATLDRGLRAAGQAAGVALRGIDQA